MKARMNPYLLSASKLLLGLTFCLLFAKWGSLAMASTATGKIIFFDDFAGDNTRGRFVMEAENYSSRIPGEEAGWYQVNGGEKTFIEGPSAGQVAHTAKDGSRGDYMESTGRAIGSPAPVDNLYYGPFLYYRVSVESPGTYRLFLRWTGHDLSSDSLYAFILKPDGTLLNSNGLNYFNYHQYRKDWIWDNRGVKNTTNNAFAGFPDSAVWEISQPGVYTICIAHRESGTALDAIVFQTDNLSAPTGAGPLQSLYFPENIELLKLDTRQIIVINGIRQARAEKIGALGKIDIALEKDLAAHKALEEMLQSGEYGNLGYSNVVAAKEEIQSAIQYEIQSKEQLEKSILKLEECLKSLGFELNPGVVR